MNDRNGDQSSPSESEPAQSQIIVASSVYPDQLPIIALTSRPLFPKLVAPITVDSPELTQLVGELKDAESPLVGVVLRRAGEDEQPPAAIRDASELHAVGVIGQVLKAGPSPATGQLTMLVGGLERFSLERLVQTQPYPIAEVSYLRAKKVTESDELKAFGLAVINSIKDLVQLNPLFKDELSMLANQGKFDDPNQLADLAAYLTSASGEDLQGILETLDVRERLEKVLGLLKKELDISRLQTKIRKEIEERVTQQQREFLLREQLKAIKKELGLEKDDKEAEIQTFTERLEVRKPSAEARERIEEEIEKFRSLEPTSPEHNLTRNYLDWLTVLPWGVESEDSKDLSDVRKTLDEHHYGLDDVKERIVEFVAAGTLRGNFAGSIMCLVGPPGVGKTSIGRSIAASLGREFYRFSLGGMRDEAEIKGHRRTYIGALPGKFIQALRTVKTQNPVIMLDEIDKVGTSFRGDPASALLEALDPEQNREFLDHYLDVRFDLSNVLFVCTANQLDTIPPPLLDRMEVIHLAGYILEEKLEIARRFIVPRELGELGLKRSQVTISVSAIREIIDGYAREAGLRRLEQEIRKIVRKVAVQILEKRKKQIRIGPKEVESFLGKRRFTDEAIYRRPEPGVVLGLAWTSMGGDTLFIEATKVHSSRAGLKQTGQLGKVMIESSEIAYTLVRTRCAEAEACRGFFDENAIHLHVPAGATPKDGPSAGITMATALYSLARNKAIKAGYAMTGEVNLRGGVMPVGGIREKVIAAKRAKVRHVVLPKENEADYLRLPDHVKKGIQVHFVSTFDEVIDLCFG